MLSSDGANSQNLPPLNPNGSEFDLSLCWHLYFPIGMLFYHCRLICVSLLNRYAFVLLLESSFVFVKDLNNLSSMSLYWLLTGMEGEIVLVYIMMVKEGC